MFVARMVFFRLHESPRYLVHAGRPQEALVSLQLISRFNGSELTLDLDDVEDHRAPQASSSDRQQSGTSGESAPFLSNGDDGDIDEHSPLNTGVKGSPKGMGETLFDADGDNTYFASGVNNHTPSGNSTPTQSSPNSAPTLSSQAIPAYSATTVSPMVLGGYHYQTPSEEHAPRPRTASHASSAPANTNTFKPDSHSQTSSHLDDETVFAEDSDPISARHVRPPLRSAGRTSRTRFSAADLRASRGSFYDVAVKKGGGFCCGWWWWRVPIKVRAPVEAWFDRFGMVLAPEWLRTTLLVWGAWFGMSLGECLHAYSAPLFSEIRS